MDISKLSAQLGKFSDMKTQLPPVQDWTPELSGQIDIEIKKDCRWFHEGDEIKREKLVRIFSTILKREGDDYFLVTPVEKWQIKVADTPFEIVLADISLDSDSRNPVIQLMSNAGDEVQLNLDHPLILEGGDVPRIEVRNGLMAKLGRNVYYQLADRAVEHNGEYRVESAGSWFVLSGD
jgi:hypothetical protein